MASGDVQGATDAFQKMSIAETTQHDSKITTPRPNLPLPRELRDHVYFYLLRHENVREALYHTRSTSTAGTGGYPFGRYSCITALTNI